ncbi:hypothetical protein DNK06_16050 [Pseudomonas daroniae]|uniref:Uncharacterized protein n=1 Tax=Phytopseudomonas daroniae TaxID=2487519 RepID=A0A4Q9QKL0_9GAMM|nr:hypothetical protein DNK06_16050 [Pseudomonas daroniae]TBU81372.1 hypothetical protein DNK31_14765 [Pseudomonas sp. FRB 228]TBU90422.1 hypothetical protein DNJ99_13330 [Pseudomonas daroniae]
MVRFSNWECLLHYDEIDMQKRLARTADESASRTEIRNCFSGSLSRLTRSFGWMIFVFTTVLLMAIYLNM